MTEQLSTSEHYRDLSYDEVLERGVERGIERGMERGIERGVKLGELRGKIVLLEEELKILEPSPLRSRYESRLETLRVELASLREDDSTR